MSSIKKRFSVGWAAGIILGIACSTFAGSIIDTYTSGDTLTAAKMNNIKTAVNGNATDITALQSRTTALENGTSSCPADMKRVGPICVDIYEASVWDAATGGSAATAARCSPTGNDCSSNTPATAIFARSVTGATAAGGFTWFQAQQACANVGKRLLTNAEWQMAAAGTPDDSRCVTGSLAATGANASCVSNWGVHDMVGNVAEWVADWIQGGVNAPTGATGGSAMVAIASGTTDVTYGSHGIVGVSAAVAGSGNPNNNFPAAIYRGGDFGDPAGAFYFNASRQPSGAAANLGFRCAR